MIFSWRSVLIGRNRNTFTHHAFVNWWTFGQDVISFIVHLSIDLKVENANDEIVMMTIWTDIFYRRKHQGIRSLSSRESWKTVTKFAIADSESRKRDTEWLIDDHDIFKAPIGTDVWKISFNVYIKSVRCFGAIISIHSHNSHVARNKYGLQFDTRNIIWSGAFRQGAPLKYWKRKRERRNYRDDNRGTTHISWPLEQIVRRCPSLCAACVRIFIQSTFKQSAKQTSNVHSRSNVLRCFILTFPCVCSLLCLDKGPMAMSIAIFVHWKCHFIIRIFQFREIHAFIQRSAEFSIQKRGRERQQLQQDFSYSQFQMPFNHLNE